MDQAGYATYSDTLALVQASSHRVFTIGLGSDYDETVLSALGTAGFAPAGAASELTAAFNAITQDLVDLVSSYYALTYCTPSRAGSHELTLASFPAHRPVN